MRYRAVNLCALLGLVAPAFTSCGDYEPIAFEDIDAGAPPLSADRPFHCGQGQATLLNETEEPDAPPYPTPVGDSAAPGITGIPLPPGSELIESFARRQSTWGDGVVQVYATHLSAYEIFLFFEESLEEAGWELTGGGGGPAGASCDYVPDRWQVRQDQGLWPRHWITISTRFIPPPGLEGERDVLPGFRPESGTFAPRVPGKTTFSVITPR